MKNTFNFFKHHLALPIKSCVIALFFFGLFIQDVAAQLITDNSFPNNSASYLVHNILMENGVIVTNVTFNGDSLYQVGYFDGSACNIGLSEGIIIANGDVNLAVGPNDQSGVTGIFPASPSPSYDPDLLDILSGTTANDAAILEFDFVATGDTVMFNYVFGSDEYLEWVFSFNDAFGFFISGPGIAGPYTNGAENIALVPGTSTPITIDNVNNVFNSVYYVDNGDGFSPPQNTDTSVVQCDGFTTVLQAVSPVQCGQTYHIKIAICDANDGVLDSWLFLESGSFKSNSIIFTTAGNDTLCDLDTLQIQAIVDTISAYTYSWNNGASLSDSTIYNPYAFPDSTTTYVVTVTSLITGCEKSDSLTILVTQPPALSLFPGDTTFCSGQSVQFNIGSTPANCGLNTSGCVGTLFDYDAGADITSTTITSPYYGLYEDGRTQILYRASELHSLGIHGGTISQIAFNVALKGSTQPYQGFTIKIGCTGFSDLSSGTFVSGLDIVYGPDTVTNNIGWNTHILTNPYDWDGVSNLLVEVCYDNSTYTSNDEIYYTATSYTSVLHTYMDGSAGCSLIGSALYDSRPNTKFTFCNTTSFDTYDIMWSPSAGLSDDTIADPIATPDSTATYILTLTHSETGCQYTVSQTIDVQDPINIVITQPGTYCGTSNPDTLIATPSGGSWSGIGIVDTVLGIFDPGTAGIGNHIITYKLPDICESSTTVTVEVKSSPPFTIRNTGPFCVSNERYLLFAIPYVGTWSGQIIDANGYVVPSDTGDYDITYSITSVCGSCDTTFTITVLPFPSHSATITSITNPSSSSICDGSITVSVSGGTIPYSYSWYPTGGTASIALGLCTGIYTVTINDANGCTIYLTDTLTTATGTLALYSNNVINLFPNPTQGTFYLDINLDIPSDVSITIFNTIGDVIESTIIKNVDANIFTIDMNGKANGIYYIHILTDKEVMVTKVSLVK
ncbi:MAG: choice-of-anchor L domain-containing protein [Bacteroidota bacterium]